MVTLTPPSSNSGTPVRPTTPPAEHAQGMDVDSVPHSPMVTPSAAAAAGEHATASAATPAPAAGKAEDTEDDEEVSAESAKAKAAAPRKSRGGKSREMFDSEVVERWNRQIGDIFTTPGPAAMPGMVPP